MQNKELERTITYVVFCLCSLHFIFQFLIAFFRLESNYVVSRCLLKVQINVNKFFEMNCEYLMGVIVGGQYIPRAR